MSKSKKPLVSEAPSDNEIILRVANLIEQGSFGMQQITGHYFDSKHKGCCAMGALHHALGITDLHKSSVMGTLGIISWPRIPYPKSHQVEVPFAANEALNTAALPDVVIFLNDRLGWSFSKIVDYLRDCTLEQGVVIRLKK